MVRRNPPQFTPCTRNCLRLTSYRALLLANFTTIFAAYHHFAIKKCVANVAIGNHVLPHSISTLSPRTLAGESMTPAYQTRPQRMYEHRWTFSRNGSPVVKSSFVQRQSRSSIYAIARAQPWVRSEKRFLSGHAHVAGATGITSSRESLANWQRKRTDREEGAGRGRAVDRDRQADSQGGRGMEIDDGTGQ